MGRTKHPSIRVRGLVKMNQACGYSRVFLFLPIWLIGSEDWITLQFVFIKYTSNSFFKGLIMKDFDVQASPGHSPRQSPIKAKEESKIEVCSFISGCITRWGHTVLRIFGRKKAVHIAWGAGRLASHECT